MRMAIAKTVVPTPNRRSTLQCLAFIVAAGAVAITTSAHAQSTGVAACDEFLTKWEACVTSKLPAAQQATYKATLDQTRKSWIDIAKNPATKSTMEATCKQTGEAMKASLQQFGCSF